MLKIKDNVDLNIFINKYDFKPEYDKDTGELLELYRINGYYLNENTRRRKTATITKSQNYSNQFKQRGIFKAYWVIRNRLFYAHKPNGNQWLSLDIDDYEILYDLITAGLVEKVEEGETNK